MQQAVHKIYPKRRRIETLKFADCVQEKNKSNYVVALHLQTAAKCCNFWQNDLRNNGNSGCDYMFSTSPGETFNARYILTMNKRVKQIFLYDIKICKLTR